MAIISTRVGHLMARFLNEQNSEFLQVGGGVFSSSSRCCGSNRSSCVHMLAVLICEPQFCSSGMHIGRSGGLEGRPSF
jgi:hypothetical protein